jgi:ABC-type Fe3+-hydroxamate transport system substrate-binding protein
VEELVESRPEVVIVGPCGVGLEAARGMVGDLTKQAWWGELPAVRAGRVAVVDGNQYFSRPGPRLVEGFEWLVGWMQGRPDLIPKGFAWEELRT